MSTFYSVSKRNYSFRPYNRKKGRRALKRKKLHTLLKTPRKQRKRRARRFYVPKSTLSHNDYCNPDNFCVFNSNGPSYTVNDVYEIKMQFKIENKKLHNLKHGQQYRKTLVSLFHHGANYEFVHN